MSTAAGIMAFASVQSAIATQQAHDASVMACQSFMPAFNGRAATVNDALSYAECVHLVYPMPLDGTEVLVIKALIVLVLVGLGIGFYKGRKLDGLGGGLLMSLIVGMGLPIAVGVLYTIGCAIWFLVTA
jgi:hypothetical protein